MPIKTNKTKNNSSSNGWNRFLNFLTNATLRSVVNENPSVATSVGYEIDPYTNEVKQDSNALDAEARPELAQLRNNLAVTSGAANTGMYGPVVAKAVVDAASANPMTTGKFLTSMLGGAAVDQGIRDYTNFNGWGDMAYNLSGTRNLVEKLPEGAQQWAAPTSEFMWGFTNPGFITGGFAEKAVEPAIKATNSIEDTVVKPLVKKTKQAIGDYSLSTATYHPQVAALTSKIFPNSIFGKTTRNLERYHTPLVEGKTMEGLIPHREYGPFYRATNVTYDDYVKNAFAPINEQRFTNLAEDITKTTEDLADAGWKPGRPYTYRGSDGEIHLSINNDHSSPSTVTESAFWEPAPENFIADRLGLSESLPHYNGDIYHVNLIRERPGQIGTPVGKSFYDPNAREYSEDGVMYLRSPATIITRDNMVFPAIGTASPRSAAMMRKELIRTLQNSHGAKVIADTHYPDPTSWADIVKDTDIFPDHVSRVDFVKNLLQTNKFPSNGYSIGSYGLFSPKSHLLKNAPNVKQTYALGNSGHFNEGSLLDDKTKDLYHKLEDLWNPDVSPAQKQILIETELNPFLTQKGFLPGFMLDDTPYFGHPMLVVKRQGGKLIKNNKDNKNARKK